MRALLIILALTLNGCTSTGVKKPNTSTNNIIIQNPVTYDEEVLELKEGMDTEVKKKLEGFTPSYSLY